VARQQDVLPALAVRCSEQVPDNPALDSAEGEQLRQAFRDNTFRNMQICAQAIKLARQLNRVDITPLFLKGTALLLPGHQRPPGFRKQVDIDLIVQPAELEQATAVLLADGYRFYHHHDQFATLTPALRDHRTALAASGAHHHLPPFSKNGYAATVELHRHHLPKRFQRSNPLAPLFTTAVQGESHGAKFLTPAVEHQLIHLLLGKLVNDSFLARRLFPLREGCDYICLLENTRGKVDRRIIEQHCGTILPLFDGLATELMACQPAATHQPNRAVSARLHTMRRRYNSTLMGSLLDTYARALHLAVSLRHNPAQLPAYLQRWHN
jgi:hypothetical protein